MVNLNGNIPNITLGLNLGVLTLLVFTIVVGGYYIDDTHKSTFRNEETNKKTFNDLNTFIDNWEKRIQISNKINNGTQAKLLGLTQNASIILQTQIANEKNLLGNLSSHRIIANISYAKQLEEENETKQFVKNITEDNVKILDNQRKILQALRNETVTDSIPQNDTIELFRQFLNNRSIS